MVEYINFVVFWRYLYIFIVFSNTSGCLALSWYKVHLLVSKRLWWYQDAWCNDKKIIQVLFSESWSKQSSVQQHTLAAARHSIICHGEGSCEVQDWMLNEPPIKHKHLESRYDKHHIRKVYTHITAIQTICPTYYAAQVDFLSLDCRTANPCETHSVLW